MQTLMTTKRLPEKKLIERLQLLGSLLTETRLLPANMKFKDGLLKVSRLTSVETIEEEGAFFYRIVGYVKTSSEEDTERINIKASEELELRVDLIDTQITSRKIEFRILKYLIDEAITEIFLNQLGYLIQWEEESCRILK